MTVRSEVFVGREAERERLRALVAGVQEGLSAAIVVTGPAGAGKSSLLERVAAEASAGGPLVLRAAGVKAESDLPFATLDALLRPVLDRRESLPSVQRAALERALALADGPPPDQMAVGAATLSLLSIAGDEGGVVCMIDDAQWADPSSIRALAFVGRRLTAEGVGLVLTVRDGEEGAAELIGLDELRLGPLPDAASRELLLSLSTGHVPEEIAAQLTAASDGNPLVLLELAARLRPEQLDGREALVGPPPPHADAETLMRERLAPVSDGPTCTALLIAAAADDDDAAIISRALETAGVSLADLEPAEAAGLLDLRPGRVVLRHPLVRSVAYHRHTPDQRRRAHAAIAAALPAGDRRRPWHLAEATAEPDEDVALALLAGADDARRRGGYPSAARAERRAADLTPDPETRAQRLLAAADDFEYAGLNTEAQAVLEEAAPLAVTPETAARVRGTRAHHVLYIGDPAAAVPMLLAEADALAANAPESAGRYLIEAAWADMLLGRVTDWLEHSGRAMEVLEPVRETSTYRVAVAGHAAALVAVGRADEAMPLLDRVLHDLLELPERVHGAIDVYGLMVHALVWIERFDDADRLLTRLIEDGRAMSAGGSLPYLLGVRVPLDLRLGQWDRALASGDEGVTLAKLSGGGSFLAGGLAARALAHAFRGDRAAAEHDAREALTMANLAAPRLKMFAYHALGAAALGEGDMATAVAELDHAAEIHDRARFAEPGGRFFEADRIEALVRTGDPRAEEAVADWEAVGRRTGRLFALATAARARALMAPDEETDARFTAALELHDGMPMPFERARTLLAYGERLRRAKRRADARGPLREALAIFDELPAPAWSAKARHELRATGGMVPARTRPETAELTAHEIQVAMMVAEGRTNREVASALFLAPKTIEHHLSAIFRKLGIKRRTELARFFAADLAA